MKLIAEIGVNHNGNLGEALRLVDAAKKSGADIVKFQTFDASDNISVYAPMAKYQKNNTRHNKSQLDLVKQYELSNDEFKKIYQHCQKLKIDFLSTAFDQKALKFLDSFNMPYIKIPSGEITNLPLLVDIGRRNKKVLLSTGMSNIDEVKKAVEILVNAGQEKNNITVLQCTSQYPAPDHTINLNAMVSMGRELGLEYGLSDHSEGITASIAATSMGASIIEKHITLDKNSKGPDHKASIDICELYQLSTEILRVIKMLGSHIKVAQKEELDTINVARKSIVATKNLSAGHLLSMDDFAIKRPGTGISPMRINEIIGGQLTRDVKIDEILNDADINIK